MDEAAERILDAALQLAEQRGWDAVHLHDVARTLGIGLPDIARHYRSKDDMVDAWFDRADRALLASGEAADFAALPVRERLLRALLAWFDALAPHRRASAAMLRYRMQPDHLHLQWHGAQRVSRTVQWWRETARLPSAGLRREAEEVALTALYLRTLWRWLRDESPGQQRTREQLARALARAERIASRLPG